MYTYDMLQAITLLNCQGGQIDQLNAEIRKKYLHDPIIEFCLENENKIKKGYTFKLHDGRQVEVLSVTKGDYRFGDFKTQIEYFKVKIYKHPQALPYTSSYKDIIRKHWTYFDIKFNENKTRYKNLRSIGI